MSTGLSCWLLARAVGMASSQHAPMWVLARAAGITTYVLVVLLVAAGILLAHPASSSVRRPRPATRLRLHVFLAVLTAGFLALHVVVLATDRWAHVGWRGVVVPMASTYRPVPVTLGVIGMYAGLLAGITAGFAGRVAGRLWWPLHRIAAATFVLAWAHGLLAGSDAGALRWLYAGTGAGLLALAASRYLWPRMAVAPENAERRVARQVP
ncbi:MAG TPA: hypothetical protein VE287_10190 [Actinopolymorphaceae bacterium]|nr:hypothetical protein [Actinopolymorphaceae bacterium]